MKTKFTVILLVFLLPFLSVAQNHHEHSAAHAKQLQQLVPNLPLVYSQDSLVGFNDLQVTKDGMKEGHSGDDLERYKYLRKKEYINRKFGPAKLRNNNPAPQSLCTNIDFESGTTAGWTTTGNTAIMSGAGLDPHGGFPVVCPTGGNFSLKLGSETNTTQSIASQTFPVTAASAYFVFDFAMVILNYPHPPSDAAKVIIQFKDQSGNIIPCPQFQCYYAITSGNPNGTSYGLNGFQTTNESLSNAVGQCCYNTTYHPWTTLGFDLTPYIGQNVTVYVEDDWCIYAADWAYCYVDGECTTLSTSVTGGCLGQPGVITAPPGMLSYTWSGPAGSNVSSLTTQTINVTVPGTYTVVALPNSACGTSTGYTLTAIFSPSAPPNVTVNSAAVCGGVGATLTANGASTYTWTPGTGLSANTGSVVTATPTITTVYTITGANVSGCTNTATSTVTVNPAPAISASSNAPLCSGQTLNLTSTGGVAYAWTGPNGFTSNSQNPSIPNITAAAAGVYSVAVTSASGCLANTTTTVTINPSLVITATGTTVCSGATINLTSTAGGAVYSWTGPNSFSSAVQNPTIASSTTAMSGTYSVTVTNAGGCVGSATTQVTVNPPPVVTVTGSTVCANATINLTSPAGGTTYSWTGPNAYTSNVQNPTIANAATNMTGSYSVTVTDANGCSSGNSANVTVNPLPNPTASSNTPLCQNQTLNLSGGGGTIYLWNGPNGFTSPSQNPIITNVTTSASGVYTLIVVDANNCQATTTTTVVVNPLPVVTVSGSTVCANATINLTSGTGTSYAWTGPNAFASALQNPTIANATTAMTGTYSVTVTDANGCVNGNSTNVTVNALPIVTANSNAPCTGFPLNLTSNGGTSWSWTGPNAFTSALQNPSIANATTTLNGAYSVVATDANGCVGNATINITVNPLPIVTISNSSPVCVNQTLNLTSGGGTGYSWSGPNGFSSNIQNPSIAGITVPAGGTYTVTVTDANGCVNTSTTTAVVNPLPVVTVSGSTVCLNATINLSANGGVNYSWSGPNAYSSNSQNPSIPNADLSMIGSYVATVTDANNCVNANVAQVVVNPLPIVGANSAVICLGQQTATLTATGAVNYAWTPTAGLSSSVGTTITANPTTTTPYTVTGTDANNCQSTGTLTVTVNPLPVFTVGPLNSSGCAPVCVNFTNTAISAGICNWNFGDGTTSTNCTPNHCFTGQGTFGAVLNLTDANGCTGSATANVIVFPNPVADFSASPQPTSILDPHIQFTNLSSGGVIVTNSWTLGDPNNTTSNQVNPSITYQAVGSYPVLLVVTTDHGCKDSTIKVIKIDDEFMLYVPNAFSPNADGTNDIFYAKGEGVRDFKMYIFDRWGQQIFFSDDIYKGWDGRFQSKGTDIVQEDVYVWKIECKTSKGEHKMLRGHVSLIK